MKKTNKFINIFKLFLLFLLINIIPVSAIMFGMYYNNVLSQEIKKLDKEIEKSFGKNMVNNKEKVLSEINEKINTYTNNQNDIDKIIINLDTEIYNTNEEIDTLTNNINTLKNELISIKNINDELNNKYSSVNSYIIDYIPTFSQHPNYPNGCENAALYILLKYYGINLTVDDTIENMEKGEIPHYENGIRYGGDPNKEFLGDPRLYDGWGIYPSALLKIANRFKEGAINGTGMDINKIYELIRSNRPVLIWTSTNSYIPYKETTWIVKETGEKIIWKNYNHAVVIFGYTNNDIVISDPMTGTIRYMNKKNFITAFEYMDRKAIYY